MTRSTKALPVRSWAYPLYDLALVGWIFVVIPVSGYIAIGRIQVAAIIVGALLLISAAAIVLGRRDGISIASYLDSSRRRASGFDSPKRPPGRPEGLLSS